MVCIYCAHKTIVTNSRSSKRFSGTWRRRKCTQCGAIFTSRENTDLSDTHRVRQSDGSITSFSRDRLFISLYQSCGHRTDALKDAAALADTITVFVIKSAQNGLILATDIAHHTHQTLTHFDQAAATYYKAYFLK